VVGVEPVVLGGHRSQIAYEDCTRQASAYDRTPIERLTTHTMGLFDSEQAEIKLLPVYTSGL